MPRLSLFRRHHTPPTDATRSTNCFRHLWWVLNLDDPYPCPECQAFAATSPYDPPWMTDGNVLNATPGDGHTRCGAACSCQLSYEPPTKLWTPHGLNQARVPFEKMELWFVEGEKHIYDGDWVDALERGIAWAHPSRADLERVLADAGVEPESDRWIMAMRLAQ